MKKTRWLVEIGVLASFITITGTIKLPGLLPGTEFQLSAPLAVAICAVFGFKNYLLAGVLSSFMGLAIGMQNLLNVLIAMIFRLTVGIILSFFGSSKLVVILAGPVGSMAARTVLGGLVGQGILPLILAAIPGMIYTALAAWPFTVILKKVKTQWKGC